MKEAHFSTLRNLHSKLSADTDSVIIAQTFYSLIKSLYTIQDTAKCDHGVYFTI